MDMADKFPTAEVTGTDLSPIQPDWVPSNCKFEVDDAMSPWTFKNDYFDYIHSRNISSGVSDWDHYIGEIKRCVSPGGYVEICEEAIAFFCDDGTMKPDNPAKIYIDQLRASMIKMGRPPPDLKFLKNLLEKAGFENVKAMQVKEPVGPWPKDPRLKTIGAMVLLHGDSAFESYGMALFTRILGMDAKAAKHLCDEGLRAVRNKNYHMYSCFYRVYGRKPVESNKREA